MTRTPTPADHRAARRARANRMRRGVAAGALTLFVGVWAGLSTQLATGGASTASRSATTAVGTKATAAAVTQTTAQAVAPGSVGTATS